MIGSSGQTIAANTFQNDSLYNLIISNSSAEGVILAGALDIYGSLTYSGTGMKLATNDNLTLKSTATNTAWLGDMTGNTITGEAIVDRYINVGTGSGQHPKTWEFLAAPTNGATVKERWMENGSSARGYGIWLTAPGGTAAGFDATSYSASIKSYNPSTDAWDGVSNSGQPDS